MKAGWKVGGGGARRDPPNLCIAQQTSVMVHALAWAHMRERSRLVPLPARCCVQGAASAAVAAAVPGAAITLPEHRTALPARTLCSAQAGSFCRPKMQLPAGSLLLLQQRGLCQEAAGAGCSCGRRAAATVLR